MLHRKGGTDGRCFLLTFWCRKVVKDPTSHSEAAIERYSSQSGTLTHVGFEYYCNMCSD